MAAAEDFARIGNYARMYNRDRNIDRRNSKRVVPMEVLCLGYSRTGTLTMQKAMEILGYPNPYHFSSVLENAREVDMWMEAIEAKYHGKGSMPDKKFWDGLLGHVGAISDAPGNLFSKELVDCYPEAKVVLVERGLESWYESWMKFCENAYNPVLFVLGRLDPSWMGRITRLGGALTTIQAGFATTVDEARVRSKAAYIHHYRDVKEMVPNDRLLEFKLKDGWQPLCRFLGKPVPDVPFPHENEAKANAQSFAEMGSLVLKRIVKKSVVGIAVLVIPVSAYWYQQTRR